MVNYEKLYCELFNAVVKAIENLREAQNQTGEQFLFDTQGLPDLDRNITKGWSSPDQPATKSN